MLAAAARDLGGDPRATEPIRMVGLVEPVPLLLIHGEADRTVPACGRSPAGRGRGPVGAPLDRAWGGPQRSSHATMPQEYEAWVTDGVRSAFLRARDGSL